ncbi:hypothetical protein JCM11641_005252 [Rhodosporidiobolus odoratus]
MLDSPESEGQDDSVTVEETEQEMEIFLAVLAGGGKEDGLLRSLDEVGWERLAELGDKYDSHVVLRVAEARAWEIDAQGKSPLHAFTLATHVGTPTLLQRTAQKAIGVTDRHTKRFGATEEWQARLASLPALLFSSFDDVFCGPLMCLVPQMTVESSQPSQAAESWAFHGKDRNAGPMGNI